MGLIISFIFGAAAGVGIMAMLQINRMNICDKIREQNQMLTAELDYRKERYHEFKNKSMKLIKQKDKKITELKSEIEKYKKSFYSGNHIPRID